MNIDLTRLNSGIDKNIDVNIDYEFKKEQLEGTDLISCTASINGVITKDSLGEIILDLNVEGIMVLPCAITLKPTEYPYNIEINGLLSEKLGENNNFFTNSLDIFPIIWENILMEIPMRVISPGAEDIQLEGDGWSFITEENINSSPLVELEDLLKEGR